MSKTKKSKQSKISRKSGDVYVYVNSKGKRSRSTYHRKSYKKSSSGGKPISDYFIGALIIGGAIGLGIWAKKYVNDNWGS